MILLGIMLAFGLLAFQGTGFVQCKKLHEILTDAEFSTVFRTTRDNGPEYEVVPIMHDLHKRSTVNLKVQFTAFDRTFNIRLNPSDGILAGENTPVWLAFAGINGVVNYKKLNPNMVGFVAKSFVEPKSFASFVVHTSPNNTAAFHGTIDDFTVVPLPARVQEVAKQEFNRSRREIPGPSRNLIQTDYHVIIKTKASPRDPIPLGKQANKIVQHFNKTDDHRRKRFANDIIYPSILVVTDYMRTPRIVLYEKVRRSIFGFRTEEAMRKMIINEEAMCKLLCTLVSQDLSIIKDEIRYQLAFWNSVDLRFRDLESPKVRLRIAGIVIGVGRQATPYIDYFSNGAYVDFIKAIKSTSSYWYYQSSNPDFKPGAYNVIITLTDYKLYDVNSHSVHTTGIAYIGGLCKSLSPANFKAAGLVTDDMKFDGINTAAHELGHILGATHDTDTTGSCANSLGYIMTPEKTETTKMNHWSSCSLDKIKHYLGHANHCADKPAEIHRPGNPIERIAPGDILTAQQQCVAQGYLYACPPEPKMCEKLQCSRFHVNGIVIKQFCRNARIGALDGTPCAPDAICVRGVCRKADQVIQ